MRLRRGALVRAHRAARGPLCGGKEGRPTGKSYKGQQGAGGKVGKAVLYGARSAQVQATAERGRSLA